MSNPTYLYFTVTRTDGDWLVIWSVAEQQEVCEAFLSPGADALSLAKTSLRLNSLEGDLEAVSSDDPRLPRRTMASSPTEVGGACQSCPARQVCAVHQAISASGMTIEVSTCQMKFELQRAR